jgi:dipeptidyl aminopeptidase/acylaminoacyl peptidase
LLVGGDSSVRIVRMSPDRSEILYSMRPVKGKPEGLTVILAIPMNGGSPREVLRAAGIDDFQCARAPANVCVLSQPNGETSLYSTFDPKTGVVKPSLRIPGGDFPDSLSPDGTTLAVAPDRNRRIPAEIQLYNLKDSSRTTLEVKGRGTVYSIDWNPDGKSLWVGAPTSEDVAGVVRVDLQGNVTPLIEDAETTVCCGIPSTDGSHVAYWRWDARSNVWLLRGF